MDSVPHRVSTDARALPCRRGGLLHSQRGLSGFDRPGVTTTGKTVWLSTPCLADMGIHEVDRVLPGDGRLRSVRVAPGNF